MKNFAFEYSAPILSLQQIASENEWKLSFAQMCFWFPGEPKGKDVYSQCAEDIKNKPFS